MNLLQDSKSCNRFISLAIKSYCTIVLKSVVYLLVVIFLLRISSFKVTKKTIFFWYKHTKFGYLRFLVYSAAFIARQSIKVFARTSKELQLRTLV